MFLVGGAVRYIIGYYIIGYYIIAGLIAGPIGIAATLSNGEYLYTVPCAAWFTGSVLVIRRGWRSRRAEQKSAVGDEAGY